MSQTENVQDTQKCRSCGQPLAPDAPHGLCPKCLLERAVAPTEPADAGASHSTTPSLDQVQIAFPHLEITALLGAGGMGAVFKARQPKLDRFVALKLLPASLSRNPAFTERFQREARSLARLSHPNIVAVYDFGEAGGYFYLMMEFVDGVNLRQAMTAGRLSPAQALQIVPHICEALQFAHENGVLHRDIKPENILLDAKGRVKIADFGIAKLTGQGKSEVTLTQSGAALGTPAYMAPEQLENPAAVDHRADIYSLGVVFYEMLTGELPLGRFAPPSQKTPLDERVDAIVLRALAKEKELRQQSAGEVKTQVENVARTSPSPPLQSSPPGETKGDFFLCNPRLPRMGQAITVYSLIVAPFLWVAGLALLDFTSRRNANAEMVQALWSAFGDIFLGFLTTLALVVGGAKLRGLKPSGPKWLRLTIWFRIALGLLSILVVSWVEVLDWESEPVPGNFPVDQAILSGLILVACGFEIATLIWLRRNRQLLKTLTATASRAGAGKWGWGWRIGFALGGVACLALAAILVSNIIPSEKPAEWDSLVRQSTWAPVRQSSSEPPQAAAAVPEVRAGFVRIDLSVPAGLGAVVEFVGNDREGVKPIPGSACYFLASADRDGTAVIQWGPSTNQAAFPAYEIPWQLTMKGEAGVVLASALDIAVPTDLARSLPTGGASTQALVEEDGHDSTQWIVERSGAAVAGVGFRVRSFSHGLGLKELGSAGFAGVGTNWSQEFPPAIRTQPPVRRFTEIVPVPETTGGGAALFKIPAGLKATFEIWAHPLDAFNTSEPEKLEFETPGYQERSLRAEWGTRGREDVWSVAFFDVATGRELKRYTGNHGPARWKPLLITKSRVRESNGFPATLLTGEVPQTKAVWNVELYYGAVPVQQEE